VELTDDDCAAVRRRFEFPAFSAHTWPSVDLQLLAASPRCVETGDYQWLVAEIHSPAALLQTVMLRGCPDPEAVAAAIARGFEGEPFIFIPGAESAVSASRPIRLIRPSVRLFGPACGPPPAEWSTARLADAEVTIPDGTGDVRLRHRDSGIDLGSFARAWNITGAFHPFIPFVCHPHTPRLRVGDVIVQRRTWTIDERELSVAKHSTSAQRMIAVQSLRAERMLPRRVFVRPPELAVSRSVGDPRSVDAKPSFVDLDSYPFVEIMIKALRRYGGLELSEMLPTPEQSAWKDADGTRSFELRGLLVPRPR
jgi:hypothetical protein